MSQPSYPLPTCQDIMDLVSAVFGIDVSINNDEPNAGDPLVFTISAAKVSGTVNDQDVIITLVIPSGFTVGTPSIGAIVGNIWTIPQSAFTDPTATVELTGNAPSSGTVETTATIAVSGLDQVQPPNSDTVTETIGGTFGNAVQSQVFTKSDCGNGYNGTAVTYTVPANTYTSAISQVDADNQALADIAANGQAYANTNGSCTVYPLLFEGIYEGDKANIMVSKTVNDTSGHVYVDWGDGTPLDELNNSGQNRQKTHTYGAGFGAGVQKNVQIYVDAFTGIDQIMAGTDVSSTDARGFLSLDLTNVATYYDPTTIPNLIFTQNDTLNALTFPAIHPASNASSFPLLSFVTCKNAFLASLDFALLKAMKYRNFNFCTSNLTEQQQYDILQGFTANSPFSSVGTIDFTDTATTFVGIANVAWTGNVGSPNIFVLETNLENDGWTINHL